jgi:hypothetical protein
MYPSSGACNQIGTALSDSEAVHVPSQDKT